MNAQADSLSGVAINRRLSGLLDCLRWLSALMVVITHTANLMVARWADTPRALHSRIQFLWTFLGGFGHQGVMTFYVLSGFLVGGPLVVEVRSRGSLPWLKYSIDRLVRIYLVLVPALGLCFLLDRITFRFSPSLMGEFLSIHTSWLVLLGNLVNLQNFFVPFFGSDGPIGTLAIEMWFYLSFPLFLVAWCRRYGSAKRIACTSLGIGIVALLTIAQPAFLAGFAIWLIGVHARLSKRPRFQKIAPPMLLLGLTFLSIRALMRRDMSNMLWIQTIADLLLTTSLHLLLVTVRHLPDSRGSFFYFAIHKRMAGFSYSLYAIHMPLLFLLTTLSHRRFQFCLMGVVVHCSQWLLVTSVVLATLISGYLFSLLTENHTAATRRWIFARLDKRDWNLNLIMRHR